MSLRNTHVKSYFFALNKSLEEIRKDCRTIFFTPDKKLFRASGAYGSIQQVCKSKNDCDYVIKAISLDMYDEQNVCKYCKSFILTNDVLTRSSWFEDWCKKTGVEDAPITTHLITMNHWSVETQYLSNRLIDSPRISIPTEKFHTWCKIHPKDCYYRDTCRTQVVASRPAAKAYMPTITKVTSFNNSKTKVVLRKDYIRNNTDVGTVRNTVLSSVFLWDVFAGNHCVSE